jgi:3-phosphoshikimate 1-carboxyvinyltransferase
LNKLSLKHSPFPVSATINLVSSKSESNRALIINALEGFRCELKNLSAARDTQTMKSLLNSGDFEANVIDAGTTMRFLASYFAVTGKTKLLTGTPRMCERPIGILVDALRTLGANISYEGVEGFPPLKIDGFQYSGVEVLTINGGVSSQFISSLCMVAPLLPNGLKIQLVGEVGSIPYIEMTLAQMRLFGADAQSNWQDNSIVITNKPYSANEYTVESDWSGASYWYSVVALAAEGEIFLKGLKSQSLQGDSAIVQIMDSLGVASQFQDGGVRLSKKDSVESFSYDFSHCPDLAQTIAVICASKNINASFTGVESLKVKETDRVKAIQNELEKFGAAFVQNPAQPLEYQVLPSNIIGTVRSLEIDTYDDHRMAMAFAPLCMVQPVVINEPQVVSKSYPSFWEDFRLVASIKEL